MKRIWIAALVLILMAVWAASCSPASPASAPASGSSSDTVMADGKALLEERCTVCHDLGRVEAKKATADEWKSTIDRMIKNGAKLSAEEQTVLVQYLAATYK